MQIYLMTNLFIFTEHLIGIVLLVMKFGKHRLRLLTKLIYSLGDTSGWKGRCFITHGIVKNKMSLSVK